MSAVTLIVVGDEIEAEAVCDLLRPNGIKCAHRRTDPAAATYGGGLPIGGATEVLSTRVTWRQRAQYSLVPVEVTVSCGGIRTQTTRRGGTRCSIRRRQSMNARNWNESAPGFDGAVC